MSKITRLSRLGLMACLLVIRPWFGSPFPQIDSGETDGGTQIHVTQVDQSQFPQITVYVSVTDAAGEPVAVDPDRLVLIEDGVAVTPARIAGRGDIGPLTTLLVMDISGSMNQAGKLAAAKAAARAYVAQMRPGDQAGLLAFNTQVDYVQPLTSNPEAMLKAVESLKARNDTAMYDALVQAAQILASVPGRKAVIVLTDGLDNRSLRTADQVLEQIGPSGLSISTIGLGDPAELGVSNAGLDEAALRTLAERAGGAYGYADDPETLRGLYERYGRALQSEYAITFISLAALRDGVNRSLTVSLDQASASGQAEYNPGGLVPEVPRRASWPIFVAALVGLFALLLAPALIRRGTSAFRGLRPGSGKAAKTGTRIRLQDESQPHIRWR